MAGLNTRLVMGSTQEKKGAEAVIPADNFDTVRLTTSTSSVRASVAKVAGFTAVAAGTVTIYANTAQSGTTVFTGTVTAGQIVTFPAPVVAALGVSVTLAGGAQIDLMVA